jgi:N-acyl-phosphatidylethanolamine-hydrolysing phospholipase D
LDPVDAVAVHGDVRSARSVAVHCCTWSLTDEALDEPPVVLAAAAAEAGLAPDAFVTLQHGATLAVGAEEEEEEAEEGVVSDVAPGGAPRAAEAARA